ncbi:MAG: hypothetical protein ACTSQY_08210 [Candidatus Odinarchaeia archaeon]
MTADAVEKLRNQYSPLMAKQELDGEFVNLYESLVYRDFDRKRNFFKELQREGCQIYAGIDWNVNIYACVIAVKVQDKIYVIDEIYGSRDVATLGKEIIKRYGYDVIICSDAMNAQSHRAILRSCGLTKIVETKSNPKRVDRYNLMNMHFCNANNIAKMFIRETRCPNLIKDFEYMVFKPGTDTPDTQHEKFGHGSDGLGYLLKYLSPHYGKDVAKKQGRLRLKDIRR